MDNIEITGAENLDESQRYFLQNFIETNYKKLANKIKNKFILKFSIKEYFHNSGDKKNKSVKYSLHAEIKSSTKLFEASSSNWDLNKAVHLVFSKLNSEIEHRFHVSKQGREQI